MGMEKNPYVRSAASSVKGSESIDIDGCPLQSSDDVEVLQGNDWTAGVITRIQSSERVFVSVNGKVDSYFTTDVRLPQGDISVAPVLENTVNVCGRSGALVVSPKLGHTGEEWSKARHSYWSLELNFGDQRFEMECPVVVSQINSPSVFIVTVQRWGDNSWKWVGFAVEGNALAGWHVTGTRRIDLQRKNIDTIYMFPCMQGCESWDAVVNLSVGHYSNLKDKAMRIKRLLLMHQTPHQPRGREPR